mmetsp:Transcript_35530/g.34548  ORF Transcript_35530/g.34548 Transcript_35530/m.34548 type:complete len:119 (+) Transcript_35530:1144-1500(+)
MKKKDSNFLGDLFDRIEQNNNMKNAMERAIMKFNEHPRKGIEYLEKHHLIKLHPDNVADFLLTTPGLSKYSIGQYLGKKEDFNLKVLKSYFEKIDFRGLEIDEAMRLFMQQFRLPGEA